MCEKNCNVGLFVDCNNVIVFASRQPYVRFAMKWELLAYKPPSFDCHCHSIHYLKETVSPATIQTNKQTTTITLNVMLRKKKNGKHFFGE